MNLLHKDWNQQDWIWLCPSRDNDSIIILLAPITATTWGYGKAGAVTVTGPILLANFETLLRNSFSRLWVAQISRHSLCTASRPRLMNVSPTRDLIWPNTGSTIWQRSLYRLLPLLVNNFRSILSRGERCLGILPLGAPCSRITSYYRKNMP